MSKLKDAFLTHVAKIAGLELKQSVSGKTLTHMKVGGTIARLALVANLQALQSLVALLKAEGLRWRILGAGSNVVLGEVDERCCLIKLVGAFDSQASLGAGLWSFGAAVPLIRTSLKMTQSGWSGLEFAAGIPAVIGGAVAMNAGAHGSCMADVVERVQILDVASGSIDDLSAADVGFGYRSSIFNQEEACAQILILGAILRFKRGDSVELLKRRANALAYRKATQPLQQPSAGSVFKNPASGESAGRLIEMAGLKGAVEGAAEISTLHANWIVNPQRSATADDVARLVQRVQGEVARFFGIDLVPEIKIWK